MRVGTLSVALILTWFVAGPASARIARRPARPAPRPAQPNPAVPEAKPAPTGAGNVSSTEELYPLVPWWVATGPIVPLMRSSPATLPATRALRPSGVPEPRPEDLQELRAQYQPVYSEREVAVYQELFADAEKKATQSKDLQALSDVVQRSAADVQSRPALQRYLLLRAVRLARNGGSSGAAMKGLCERVLPLLTERIPSHLVQRAEVLGALAEVNRESRLEAGEAFYALATWQVNHSYLEQAAGSLSTAESFARLCVSAELLDSIRTTRDLLQRRTQARDHYARLAESLKLRPNDPKLNGQMARYWLAHFLDLGGALPYAARSDDSLLLAVAKGETAGSGQLGLALAALAEAAPPEEKAAFAQLSRAELKALTNGQSDDAALFLRAKQALRNMEAILKSTGAAGANAVFQPTDAARVVYVCDASGSMVTKIDDLRGEIRKSIGNLGPTQFFNVIFFQDVAWAASDARLLPATDENKGKVNLWLDKISAHGQTDPIPALRKAFGYRPDVLYLLTDGDFPDSHQVMQAIRQLNVGQRSKIHTIAYFDRGEEYEKVLKQIATENGGTFRFVGAPGAGDKE